MSQSQRNSVLFTKKVYHLRNLPDFIVYLHALV
jgi:hypothetical protein